VKLVVAVMRLRLTLRRLPRVAAALWVSGVGTAFLAGAEAPRLLILEKAHSRLGFYTESGERTGGVEVGLHPHEMVLSLDGRLLYISDNGKMRMEDPGEGGNTISIVDLQKREKIAEINLGRFRRPHGLDLDAQRRRLVVTAEYPDQLLVIDLSKRAVARHFDTRGKTSHMVTLGPRGQWAYVSNSDSGNVSAIHLESGDLKIIPTGERTQGGALSRDGRELYIVSKNSDLITVIDTARQEKIGTIKTGAGPGRVALTPDGQTLVYCLGNAKAVGFADPQSRKETGQVPLGGEPVSLTLSPDWKRAYASAQFIDRVYVVSVLERRVVREIATPAGSGPDPVLELP
jgi:YVTN family beta-propeller protein